MDDKKTAKLLFEKTRDRIPSSGSLTIEALRQSRFDQMGLEDLKANFSKAVSELQLAIYDLYLKREKEAAAEAIKEIFSPAVATANSNEQALSIVADKFGVLDKFSLSLSQSRKSRAGTAFEVLVSELFSKMSYPYTPQPNIGGSTPDYVLPSENWYNRYPSDCIIFTLKRTLRERWRQIVTESSSGKIYLATIDDKVSRPGLAKMMEHNITLVVPSNIKSLTYSDVLNVISFEDFFEDHLDPAMLRWKKSGAS